MSTTPSSILNGTCSRSKQRPSSTNDADRRARAGTGARACSCRFPTCRGPSTLTPRAARRRARARARRARGATDERRRLPCSASIARVRGDGDAPSCARIASPPGRASATSRAAAGRAARDRPARAARCGCGLAGVSRLLARHHLRRTRPRTAGARRAPRRASRRARTSRSPRSAADRRPAPATCRPACRPRARSGLSLGDAGDQPEVEQREPARAA